MTEMGNLPFRNSQCQHCHGTECVDLSLLKPSSISIIASKHYLTAIMISEACPYQEHFWTNVCFREQPSIVPELSQMWWSLQSLQSPWSQYADTVENMNYCDTYVVGTLVTKLGKAEAETSNQTKTLYPVWQETVVLPISEEHVEEGTLTLAVYSCDKYSRQNCLGEAQLNLSDVVVDVRTNSWINLKAPEKDSVTSPGEILLSINYLPAANRLSVVVMKARHLNLDKLKDLIDISVKLTLLHQSLKLKKKHTRHVKHKINPVWNEMIMFEVPYELLSKSCLELEMLNKDWTGQNHLLGKCSLGLNSNDLELSHWQEMLNKPRKQIAMWHKLHA
ncbi:synaptotagmin-13 isoform X2 [Cetorhinus maximus]